MADDKIFCGKGLLAQLEEVWHSPEYKIPKVVNDVDKNGNPIKRFEPDFEVKIDPTLQQKLFGELLKPAFVPFWSTPDFNFGGNKSDELKINIKRKKIKFNFKN